MSSLGSAKIWTRHASAETEDGYVQEKRGVSSEIKAWDDASQDSESFAGPALTPDVAGTEPVPLDQVKFNHGC